MTARQKVAKLLGDHSYDEVAQMVADDPAQLEALEKLRGEAAKKVQAKPEGPRPSGAAPIRTDPPQLHPLLR